MNRAKKPDSKLQPAVDELLAIERAISLAEDTFAEQKAAYKAHLQQLGRARREVLAELRGEGRQTRLRFDPQTGEVFEPSANDS